MKETRWPRKVLKWEPEETHIRRAETAPDRRYKDGNERKGEMRGGKTATDVK